MNSDGKRDAFSTIDVADFHNRVFSVVTRYCVILDEAILSQNINIDKKLAASFSKKLLDYNSYSILFYVWRRSEYGRLQHSEIDMVKPIVTCFSIARRIAYDSDTSSHAANEAVNAVCRAAIAYGLIEPVMIAKNKIDLQGTHLLHALMVGVCLPHVDVTSQLIQASISVSCEEFR